MHNKMIIFSNLVTEERLEIYNLLTYSMSLYIVWPKIFGCILFVYRIMEINAMEVTSKFNWNSELNILKISVLVIQGSKNSALKVIKIWLII